MSKRHVQAIAGVNKTFGGLKAHWPHPPRQYHVAICGAVVSVAVALARARGGGDAVGLLQHDQLVEGQIGDLPLGWALVAR